MDVSEVEDLLQFQSTLPVRGATAYCYVSGAEAVISIHAPRKGSDMQHWHPFLYHPNFNPRSP